jgi:hypothetical protein
MGKRKTGDDILKLNFFRIKFARELFRRERMYGIKKYISRVKRLNSLRRKQKKFIEMFNKNSRKF